MSNSKLFTDAHKLTKMEISMSQRNVALTIQPNETYRYKFGQWLIFLKTGVTNITYVTNMIKPQNKRINQSVAYVPILDYDREFVKYRLSLPMTFSKEVKRANGNMKYIQHWYINKYISGYVKYVFTNPITMFIMFITIVYMLNQ